MPLSKQTTNQPVNQDIIPKWSNASQRPRTLPPSPRRTQTEVSIIGTGSLGTETLARRDSAPYIVTLSSPQGL